jgi:hypothetical protein
MSTTFFFRWIRIGRPIHIGITYWYRKGWPASEIYGVLDVDAMPSSHEFSIGLFFFRMGIEVETSIPKSE